MLAVALYALYISFQYAVLAEVPDFPVYVRSKNDNAPCARYAVAMSGGIRTLTHRLNLFQTNIVEANNNDVDVYAHLYLTDPADNFRGDFATLDHFAARPYVKQVVVEMFNQTIQEQIITDLRGTWDSCLANIPLYKKPKGGIIKSRLRNMSMFRKIYLAYQQVLKSGCHYQLVVRARADISHRRRMRLGKVRARPGDVYGPWREPKKEGIMTDHLAVGDMQAMRNYCSTYLKLNTTDFCHTLKVSHPEYMLTQNVKGFGKHVAWQHPYDFILDANTQKSLTDWKTW
eukprot:CAMPEP_0118926622 /NCGR_PEP_ID=MMETSP1169-20130426/4273_1 /TAXON_ID=36882 /ORGANISM="Pyramimonas obovata, Strain CCMP722" /LENGTH=286 /DNA_ID=CAMNT_0006868215 /DNA_START=83 /DNA_END=940 /DNA_ORIENTATION=-